MYKLIISLILMVPLTVFAVDVPSPIHYRTDTKVMIPKNIEIVDSVSIPAIIGETLQSPIIKIMINDQGPFLFALDTGFSDTIISKQLADKLNLPIIRKNKVKYVTPNGINTEFENTLLINKIQMGNMTVTDYGAIGSSTSKQDDVKFKKLRVDGLISINMFHGVLLTLDYKNEMLHIQKGELSSSDKEVLPYQKGYTIPVIEAHIQSEKLEKDSICNFILDTGEPTYIYINICALPIKALVQGTDKFMQYDLFGNAVETSLAQLNGDIKLSESVVLKSPNITFSQLNCAHSSGVGRFGRKFFEMHEAIFDNKKGLVKIK